MAETLTAAITAQSKFFHQNSEPFSTTYSGRPTLTYTSALNSPTKLYYATLSATTSPTNIDVTSLTDAYGNALNFAHVQSIQIVNNDATNSLTVGGGSNALFAALPSLTAGGCYLLTTTLTVSGSVKIIGITAGAGTVSTSIVITGN